METVFPMGAFSLHLQNEVSSSRRASVCRHACSFVISSLSPLTYEPPFLAESVGSSRPSARSGATPQRAGFSGKRRAVSRRPVRVGSVFFQHLLKINEHTTGNFTYVIDKLVPNTSYCVSVYLTGHLLSNSLRSPWKCTRLPPRPDSGRPGLEPHARPAFPRRGPCGPACVLRVCPPPAVGTLFCPGIGIEFRSFYFRNPHPRTFPRGFLERVEEGETDRNTDGRETHTDGLFLLHAP